ncbi:hypothetical protein SANTM175S_09272 [Streptomyces antimycoticus]
MVSAVGMPRPCRRPRPVGGACRSPGCGARSGDRRSTPVSSSIRKCGSPTFHFSEEAPVQNQRKEIALPSKDALPSYALKDSGAGGTVTRCASAGTSASGQRDSRIRSA